jgi:hypothetical protein
MTMVFLMLVQLDFSLLLKSFFMMKKLLWNSYGIKAEKEIINQFLVIWLAEKTYFVMLSLQKFMKEMFARVSLALTFMATLLMLSLTFLQIPGYRLPIDFKINN